MDVIKTYLKLAKSSVKEIGQVFKRLDLRMKVTRLDCFDDLSEDYSLTSISNIERLEGFIDAEYRLNENDRKAAIICMLEAEEGNKDVEVKVSAIIQYFKARKDCAFPEVAKFMDDIIAEFHDEEFLLGSIATVFYGYKKDAILEPFDSDSKDNILKEIKFIGKEDLDDKNRESLIKIMNAAILTPLDYTCQIKTDDNDATVKKIISHINI